MRVQKIWAEGGVGVWGVRVRLWLYPWRPPPPFTLAHLKQSRLAVTEPRVQPQNTNDEPSRTMQIEIKCNILICGVRHMAMTGNEHNSDTRWCRVSRAVQGSVSWRCLAAAHSHEAKQRWKIQGRGSNGVATQPCRGEPGGEVGRGAHPVLQGCGGREGVHLSEGNSPGEGEGCPPNPAGTTQGSVWRKKVEILSWFYPPTGPRGRT